MENASPTRSKVSPKISIVILILFAAGAGLIFWQGYYQFLGGLSQQIAANPAQRRAAEQLQLEKNYRERFIILTENYLAAAQLENNFSSADFLNRTLALKENFLALVVTESFRDYHLIAVLILEQIENQINSGETQNIADHLNRLEELLQYYR